MDAKDLAPLGMPQKVLINKNQRLRHLKWCRILFSINSIVDDRNLREPYIEFLQETLVKHRQEVLGKMRESPSLGPLLVGSL